MKESERVSISDIVTWGLCLAILVYLGLFYYEICHPPITEADGMQWRPTGGAGMLQGAKAADGTILIPQEYDEVKYHPNRFFGGHFTARRDGIMACFDRQGHCLISLERGYTHIRLTGGFDPWFEVRNQYEYGACYITGEEAIPPYQMVVLKRGEVFIYKNWCDRKFQADRDVPPGYLDDYL